MFVTGMRGVRGMRGLSDYVPRSPMFKVDNWVQVGSGGSGASSLMPSTGTIELGAGILGLAAAAGAAWYFLKKK